MIVDWQPEQRGDLEVSMRDGLVVVGYDAQGFRLLRDCHVNGTYGFMGMTRRERVVRLESADDVRANLPLGGLGLAAKLGGELEKGATVDIAMVMSGSSSRRPASSATSGAVSCRRSSRASELGAAPQPPAEAAQPPAEAAQPPAEAAQPPAEAAQPPAEAAQPPAEVGFRLALHCYARGRNGRRIVKRSRNRGSSW